VNADYSRFNGEMRSVPPRGSGWVFRWPISDCQSAYC